MADINSNGNKNNYQNTNRRIPVESRASYIKRINAQKRRKNAVIGRIAATSAVIVLLTGVVAAATIISKDDSKNTEVIANEKETSLSRTEKIISSYAAESEETNNEESENEPKIKYLSENIFSLSQNELSEKEQAILDANITSEFIVLYDLTEDKILYRKNSDKKLYPASTTKLLTAIVASQIIPEDTVITVGDEITLIGEESSTAYLEKGMKLTFEMLIDALLLPSGNDAAYTIAVNAAKIYSEDDTLSDKEAVKIFMELVNDAAKQLGCENTHFITPDGWHDDNHYTTAEDLAKIAAYARTIPLIKNSCSKSYVEWELIKDDDEKEIKKEIDEDDEEIYEDGEIRDKIAWYNSNKLILGDSGSYSKYADGMKTGFTDEAGSSVVASATIDNHTLIAVVMNGKTLYSKYNDANLLFSYGFDIYNKNYTFENQKEVSDSLIDPYKNEDEESKNESELESEIEIESEIESLIESIIESEPNSESESESELEFEPEFESEISDKPERISINETNQT